MSARRSLAAGLLWPLLSGAIGLALWEGLVRAFHVKAYLVPAPSAVIATIIEQAPYLLHELAVTVMAAGLGLVM